MAFCIFRDEYFFPNNEDGYISRESQTEFYEHCDVALPAVENAVDYLNYTAHDGLEEWENPMEEYSIGGNCETCPADCLGKKKIEVTE